MNNTKSEPRTMSFDLAGETQKAWETYKEFLRTEMPIIGRVIPHSKTPPVDFKIGFACGIMRMAKPNHSTPTKDVKP